MEKVTDFTCFEQKKPTSGVKLCTIATVTVHICTVTVAYAFNILLFFSLSTSLSLFLYGLTLHLIRVPSFAQRSQQLSKEEKDK